MHVKTDDDLQAGGGAASDQARPPWTKDFPKWLGENARPFFVPETSQEMVQFGIDVCLRASMKALLDTILVGLEPNPALVIDRHWTLISSNRAVPPLFEGAANWLVQPPVNVIRLSLHPEGIAPRIVNLHEWRPHLLERLRRQIESSGDPVLLELLKEVRGYPDVTPGRLISVDPDAALVPLRLAFGNSVFNFLSTTMLFGTPLDITLSELAIEVFFPADTVTTESLQESALGAG